MDGSDEEASLEVAIGKALAVSFQNVEDLKKEHGESFLNLGRQAEAWIEASYARHHKGGTILAQLGEPTKPDEELYYAALLTFRDRVERSQTIDEASTVANSLGDSSSEPSEAETRSLSLEVDPWNSMRYRTQLQACRAYAHHPDDVFLVDAFLSLAELPDIDEDSVKLVLRSVKLLRLCDYSAEDLCSILAHASAYFLDAFGLCGVNMDPSEVGNVLVSLMFVAHCYVQDETCPLHVWHQHLFRKYCPLRTLNSAIIRLLEIRQYVLRLSSQELNRRYATLFKACNQNVEVEDTTSHERNEALAHRLREDATK
jgi:hypothetical protein